VSPETLSALRLDPRTDREWHALLVMHAGDAVTYRGRRTDDGVALVSGGTLPAPMVIEDDGLTILRTLALDVVRRRPTMRLDAEAMALASLPTLRPRLSQRVWAISELELLAD
jgi:hypothetical protein